jgi:hypothetical protein
MVIANNNLILVKTSKKSSRNSVEKFYDLFQNIIRIVAVGLTPPEKLKVHVMVLVEPLNELKYMIDLLTVRFIKIKAQFIQ